MSNWVQCRLGEVVELQQGLVINSKTSHLIVDDGIPLLRITDLINNTESRFIDREKVPQKFITKPSDLIYTRTGQVGLVFKGRVGIIHNNCFRVIPHDDIDVNYLYWFLKQEDIFNYVNSVASGAAQPDLNHDAFKSIRFAYPPLPTQRKIADVLSAYDDLIEVNTRRIRILEQMAQSVYREWFKNFHYPSDEKAQLKKTDLGNIPTDWQIVDLENVCKRITDGSHGSPPSVKTGYPMASVKDMNTWDFDVSKCRMISEPDYCQNCQNGL